MHLADLFRLIPKPNPQQQPQSQWHYDYKPKRYCAHIYSTGLVLVSWPAAATCTSHPELNSKLTQLAG